MENGEVLAPTFLTLLILHSKHKGEVRGVEAVENGEVLAPTFLTLFILHPKHKVKIRAVKQ